MVIAFLERDNWVGKDWAKLQQTGSFRKKISNLFSWASKGDLRYLLLFCKSGKHSLDFRFLNRTEMGVYRMRWHSEWFLSNRRVTASVCCCLLPTCSPTASGERPFGELGESSQIWLSGWDWARRSLGFLYVADRFPTNGMGGRSNIRRCLSVHTGLWKGETDPVGLWQPMEVVPRELGLIGAGSIQALRSRWGKSHIQSKSISTGNEL